MHEIFLAEDGVLPLGGGSTQHLLKLRQSEPSGYEHLFLFPRTLKSFFALISQVLVLAPTREIAVQIHSVFMAIGCAMEGLECHVFIGGRAVSQDKHHLKKCHIAVGSPGKCWLNMND